MRRIRRRIKGIVRTVVAIAGAISLNSPMMGMVAAGSGQGFSSASNGVSDVACKTGSALTGVDQPVSMKGRIGKLEAKEMASGRSAGTERGELP